ncbi:hypothetical protein ACHAWF_016451 [Thalassiosira exigua]
MLLLQLALGFVSFGFYRGDALGQFRNILALLAELIVKHAIFFQPFDEMLQPVAIGRGTALGCRFTLVVVGFPTRRNGAIHILFSGHWNEVVNFRQHSLQFLSLCAQAISLCAQHLVRLDGVVGRQALEANVRGPREAGGSLRLRARLLFQMDVPAELEGMTLRVVRGRISLPPQPRHFGPGLLELAAQLHDPRAQGARLFVHVGEAAPVVAAAAAAVAVVANVGVARRVRRQGPEATLLPRELHVHVLPLVVVSPSFLAHVLHLVDQLGHVPFQRRGSFLPREVLLGEPRRLLVSERQLRLRSGELLAVHLFPLLRARGVGGELLQLPSRPLPLLLHLQNPLLRGDFGPRRLLPRRRELLFPHLRALPRAHDVGSEALDLAVRRLRFLARAHPPDEGGLALGRSSGTAADPVLRLREALAVDLGLLVGADDVRGEALDLAAEWRAATPAEPPSGSPPASDGARHASTVPVAERALEEEARRDEGQEGIERHGRAAVSFGDGRQRQRHRERKLLGDRPWEAVRGGVAASAALSSPPAASSSPFPLPSPSPRGRVAEGGRWIPRQRLRHPPSSFVGREARAVVGFPPLPAPPALPSSVAAAMRGRPFSSLLRGPSRPPPPEMRAQRWTAASPSLTATSIVEPPRPLFLSFLGARSARGGFSFEVGTTAPEPPEERDGFEGGGGDDDDDDDEEDAARAAEPPPLPLPSPPSARRVVNDDVASPPPLLFRRRTASSSSSFAFAFVAFFFSAAVSRTSRLPLPTPDRFGADPLAVAAEPPRPTMTMTPRPRCPTFSNRKIMTQPQSARLRWPTAASMQRSRSDRRHHSTSVRTQYYK